MQSNEGLANRLSVFGPAALWRPDGIPQRTPQIWTAAPIHVRDFVSPCPDPRGPSARRSEMVEKQPLFAGAESGTILLGLGFVGYFFILGIPLPKPNNSQEPSPGFVKRSLQNGWLPWNFP